MEQRANQSTKQQQLWMAHRIWSEEIGERKRRKKKRSRQYHWWKFIWPCKNRIHMCGNYSCLIASKKRCHIWHIAVNSAHKKESVRKSEIGSIHKYDGVDKCSFRHASSFHGINSEYVYPLCVLQQFHMIYSSDSICDPTDDRHTHWNMNIKMNHKYFYDALALKMMRYRYKFETLWSFGREKTKTDKKMANEKKEKTTTKLTGPANNCDVLLLEIQN